jgi:hypothetical protein
LRDLSRAAARSPGLTLNNDYNALYAEYLFRAKGDTGDWLVYRLPDTLAQVKLVAFFAKDGADLVLETSSDGNTYTALALKRTERRLPSPPGGAAGAQRRTLVDYDAATPPGHSYLRIRWQGPAELDRVEAWHTGARR